MANLQKLVNGVLVDLTEEEILEKEEQAAVFESKRLRLLQEAEMRQLMPSVEEQVNALWEWVVREDKELLNQVEERIKAVNEKYRL